MLLAWLTAVPALLVAGWLVAAYPLVRAGHATPVPALLLAAVVIGGLLAATRGLPPIRDTPLWTVVGTLAVTVAFGLLSASRSVVPVMVRRDPGVYAIVAHWLAGHGGLGLPAGLVGSTPASDLMTAASPGFYVQDGTVVPQFMSGTGTALLPGGWLAGWTGIGVLAAVYAAAALLAVAGLAARLIGPRWAPLAALTLGLSQPELLTARTTLSEPLSQLLLLGALCLLIDAGDPAAAPAELTTAPVQPAAIQPAAIQPAAIQPAAVRPGGRALAALAGLLFGLGLLVRFDTVRELLLLVPALGWLAARRRPQWIWMLGGIVAGALFGLADALGPSRSYVAAVLDQLHPAVVAGPVLLAGTVAAVLVVRRFGVPVALRRWVAAAGGLAVAAAAGLLWARPGLQTARQGPDVTSPVVAGLQHDQQLALDSTRTYAEQSLRWLSWYLGWATLALAAAGAVVLTWAMLRGRANRWVLVLPMLLASTALVLYRPGITPDHPWADRRLVPTVLPTVVLLAVAAVAGLSRTLGPALAAGWNRRRAAGRQPARWPRRLVALAGAAALAGPALLASRPLLTARTEVGEATAVETVCAAFGPGDVALAIDARSRQELVASLRLVCEVPVYAVPGVPSDLTASRAQVDAAAGQVRAAGGRPVLVAQSAQPLPMLTSAPQRLVAELSSSEHERVLVRPPTRLTPLRVEIWVAAAD